MARAKAAGAKSTWQPLTGGKGYMGISLDSTNHRGEGLSAMVDWVNAHGQFDQVLIGLSDTLNRHNYARDRGLSLREAYDLASRKGDDWLETNRATLNGLKAPFDIKRWSHWRNQHTQAVRKNRDLFLEAYDNDPAFNASLDSDIAGFLKRKSSGPDAKTIASCRDYLIEELAVYSVILAEYPATVIYPGKQLNCFAYLRDHQPENLPNAIGPTGFIRLGIHGLNRSTQGQPERHVA